MFYYKVLCFHYRKFLDVIFFHHKNFIIRNVETNFSFNCGNRINAFLLWQLIGGCKTTDSFIFWKMTWVKQLARLIILMVMQEPGVLQIETWKFTNLEWLWFVKKTVVSRVLQFHNRYVSVENFVHWFGVPQIQWEDQSGEGLWNLGWRRRYHVLWR